MPSLATARLAEPDSKLIEETVAYLSSEQAWQSMEADPYWPKWCSPWWQMLLLYEIGLAPLIPDSATEKMVACINKHFLRFFPFTEKEIPPGFDPRRHIICHCALGCMHQVLSACGIDIYELLPWVRPWYLRYQLQDGGLNCDESAYTKSAGKSSLVSTLPPLEAVLNCTKGSFSQAEIEFLDRGAAYLLNRSLVRSASSGRLIDESWLSLCFPRFYHYDQLRGLNFVLNWAIKLKRKISLKSISETLTHIDSAFPDGRICVQYNAWIGSNSIWYDQNTASWFNAAAGSFPLLRQLSKIGQESAALTKAWTEAKGCLLSLACEELIVE